MAVTQIRKVSSYTLLALVAITIAIFLLFFFGGSELDAKENRVFHFTDAVMYWTYFLSILTLIVTIGMVVYGALNQPALSSARKTSFFGSLAVLVVACVLGFVLSDSTPLLGLNADSQSYNTAGWLTLTDTALYMTYILFVAVIGAMCWGTVRKLTSK